MSAPSPLQVLPGPFNFARRDPEEIQRILPELGKTLPLPKAVYLEDEVATPVHGFVIHLSDRVEAMRQALRAYLQNEESLQASVLARETSDKKQYSQSWERYRTYLARAIENTTISSYGRQFPSLFWLFHSLDIARFLKETPKRILRMDTELGRRYGEHIRYRVLDRYLERVFSVTYDVVQKVSAATEEVEEELFPRLLNRMRDNVLILTEDHISRDLGELSGYFAAVLRIEARDFRQRLEEVQTWHAEQLAVDRELRDTVSHLCATDANSTPRDLLLRPGYVSFLATRRGWSSQRLLTPPLVQVWEQLLVKLKEFELLHSLRRTLLLVEGQSGRFVCRDPGAARAASGAPARSLSAATRPLDFLASWVVDPKVDRFGLIYDICDFSQSVSILQRSGEDAQDEAFRSLFRYQRRVNHIAQARRVQLEKYLGDGAFYSSREALRMVICAVQTQRAYAHALSEGFEFDQGLRIALNHGHYRLIPMGGGPGQDERYEFFGHGLVELSRLVTGKATREIEEVKHLLLHLGYPAGSVEKFFEPLMRSNTDVVDKREEARPFFAYIDRNGNLVNRGIVATEAFIVQLARAMGPREVRRLDDEDRCYLGLLIEEGNERMPIGLRKLGLAHFKGLANLAIYEIVDAADLDFEHGAPLPEGDLVTLAERELRSRSLPR